MNGILYGRLYIGLEPGQCLIAFQLFVAWEHRKGTSDFERLLNPLALYEPVWVFYHSSSNCEIQPFEVTRKTKCLTVFYQYNLMDKIAFVWLRGTPE